MYTDKPGQPPLATRLMAGLAILKHMYDLSDEVLCDRWIENPYCQYFCGEEFFQHRLVFDRSSLTRWRQRMGEEKLQALLQESLAVATRTEAMKPSDLARVVIDTTVQPEAVTFPTNVKLLNRARERLVRLARKHGLRLRQSYRRVGKLALIKHQRYARAHQFQRANRALRKLKTYLGRIIRDIVRKIAGHEQDNLTRVSRKPFAVAISRRERFPHAFLPIDCGGFRRISNRDSLRLTRSAGGFGAPEGATRDGAARSVPRPIGPDDRPEPRTGEA